MQVEITREMVAKLQSSFSAKAVLVCYDSNGEQREIRGLGKAEAVRLIEDGADFDTVEPEGLTRNRKGTEVAEDRPVLRILL